jgi:hypothetical protein
MGDALMSLLCKLFGHARPKAGWWGDGLYGRVRRHVRDGLGVHHFTLTHRCPRCDQTYIAARFHGESVVAQMDKEPI